MPEDKKIISSISSIIADINYAYRISKAPKFIKDIQRKNRKKKVLKIINQLSNTQSITSDIVIDYLYNIYAMYPPTELNNVYGKFGHCIKVYKTKREDRFSYAAAFEFIISQEKNNIKSGIVSVSNANDPNKLTLSYNYVAHTNNNDKVINTIVKSDVENIYDYKTYCYNDLPQTNANVMKIIQDMFVKTLCEDIHEFLMNDLERSERI